MKFKVTLKRTVYAEVEIEGFSTAQVKALVELDNNDLDYYSMSEIASDEIKVVSVKKVKEQK